MKPTAAIPIIIKNSSIYFEVHGVSLKTKYSLDPHWLKVKNLYYPLGINQNNNDIHLLAWFYKIFFYDN